MGLESLEFFHWLTTCAEKNGITFSTHQWKHLPPGFPKQIVYAYGRYHDRDYFGIGHSVSSRLAYVIAGAELLERIGMASAKFTNSNGCAVHTDPDLARESARSELLERDSFLCHFNSGIPCTPLPDSLAQRFEEIRSFVNSLGRDFSAGILLNEEGLPMVIAGMNGFKLPDPEGIFLGLGTAPTFEAAFEKALAECLRFLEVHLERKTEPLPLEDFKELKVKGVHEHIRLAIGEDFGSKAWARLFPPVTRPALPFRKLQFQYEEFPLSKIFPGCPLHFVRATSPDLVMVEFGNAWERSHSPERLVRFSSTPLPEILPHPLG